MTTIKSENTVKKIKKGLLYFGKVNLTIHLSNNKNLEVIENYTENKLSNFNQGQIVSITQEGFQFWKRGILAGIEYAYGKLNHKNGLKVVIENAEGLFTDTNPTIIGFSALKAILDKLPNSESKNELEKLEKMLFSSYNYDYEAIPNFIEKTFIGKQTNYNKMEKQECNLNIRYDLPDKIFNKVDSVYRKMNGWVGYGSSGKGETGIPYWFSFDETQKSISASVEPSGILFTANMELSEWIEWKTELKKVATETLGFKVGEIEEGEVEYEIEWINKKTNNKEIKNKGKLWWQFWK